MPAHRASTGTNPEDRFRPTEGRVSLRRGGVALLCRWRRIAMRSVPGHDTKSCRSNGSIWSENALAIAALSLALAAGAARAENLDYCYMGLGAHGAGSYELGIDYYTRCIDWGDLVVANLAAAYFNRGNAHYDLSAFDQAIGDYDAAIRLDLRAADIYTNRGLAYIHKDNYGQAIWNFGEAIRVDPGFALAYHNRCLALALTRRPKEALQDCNSSLRLVPDTPLFLDSRALVYWLLEKHGVAQQDLERAREIDPGFPTWQERFREFEGMF
jgi:tetratricopeptide (TPR) repeat protein